MYYAVIIIILVMIHIFRGCCSQVLPSNITPANFYKLFSKYKDTNREGV